MLRYFRINDPYRLLGLLAILLLLYIPTLWDTSFFTVPEMTSIILGEKIVEGFNPYSTLIDSTAPISTWFFGLVDLLFGRSLLARHILAFIILFTQSGYLGMTFINKKVFKESTYIPSFFFSILSFFSFDTLTLSSELLGCGFLLLALTNLFNEIEFRTQKDETIFNLGIYISLASLCNFSFIVHFFGVITILILFTRTSMRSFILLAIGFLLPHFFTMAIYFTTGNLGSLWQYFYLPNLSFFTKHFMTASDLLMLGAVPLVFLLISLIMLTREARLTKYQSQLLQSMFFWMIFSFLQALYDKELRPQSFIAMIPSLSFFFTHFILIIRRKRFAEMNIWLFLFGIVTVSYLARYDKIASIKYDNLLLKESKMPKVSNKKILVLDDDITVFRENTLATPFLNWRLSRDIFENPDYYENVIMVYDALKNDPPQIIIDQNDLMKKFFERMPELKKKYTRLPGQYQMIEDRKKN